MGIFSCFLNASHQNFKFSECRVLDSRSIGLVESIIRINVKYSTRVRFLGLRSKGYLLRMSRKLTYAQLSRIKTKTFSVEFSLGGSGKIQTSEFHSLTFFKGSIVSLKKQGGHRRRLPTMKSIVHLVIIAAFALLFPVKG